MQNAAAHPNPAARLVAVLVAVVLVVGAAVTLFSQPLAVWGLGRGLAMFGMQAQFRSLHVGAGGTHAEGVVVRSNAGEPIATIDSVDVRYSLRDALPGGARQFGLQSFDVVRPHLIVIRHKNGSYNIPIPKQNAGGAPSSTPLIFRGAIHDGSIDVYDGAQGVPAARHLIVRAINGSADVATNAEIAYDGSLDYVQDGNAYPVTARGHLDTVAQFGSQRVIAAHLPIARIVDFAVNSPSFHMLGGELQNVRAVIVAAPGRDGGMQQHVDASAYLAKTRLAIGGLVKPLRDVHGPVAVYDNGLLLQDVRGTLAAAPVRLGGGLFDFSKPQFRLTVATHGDLRDLRQALAQTNKLQVHGPAQLDVLVEGSASKPVDLIALRSSAPGYATTPFGTTNTAIAFDGQEADLLAFHTTYTGVDVSARGRIALHDGPDALQVLGTIAGNAANVPYASALVPGMPLWGTILASGNSLSRVTTRGVLGGKTAASSLAGTFHIAGNGVGTAGPLELRSGSGSLYGIAYIDHPHDRVDGYLNASRMPFQYGGVAATMDGRVTGTYNHGRLGAAGLTQFAGLRTPYGRVAHATVHFGQSSNAPLAVALDATGIGALDAVASAMLTYENGNVHVQDAALADASTFADARGTVANVTGGTPSYDVRANVHSADIGSLVAMAQPSQARLVEGSADARLHVSGSGARPSIAGDVSLPEGAVNGLPFSNLNAGLSGDMAALAVRDGSVRVGSTDVAFNGAYSASATQVSVRAPHANLADFNDFFDPGDMLGGTGRFAASATMAGRSIATSGSAAIAVARVRSFVLGNADADWRMHGRAIATRVAFGGSHGTVRAHGDIALNGGLSMAARASNMDLAFWLPMAGITAPISGIADATGNVSGRFPALNSNVDATLRRATIGRVAIASAHARASTAGGRGTLTAFDARLAHVRVTGSGTFGLASHDPLALHFRATTPNVADVAYDATGTRPDAAGALDTTLTIAGTRVQPRVADRFTLTQARYGRFTVPRALGTIAATSTMIALRGGEVDLQRGRLLAEAMVPVTLSPFAVDPRDRPVSGWLTADDVEASNVAPLLPKGTKLSGRLDGRIALAGSVHQPQFNGMMDLAGVTFSGPQERVPLTGGSARLALHGQSVALQRAHADVGGGSLDASGVASVPEINDMRAVRADFRATAKNARVDLPAYLKGTINANLALSKAPGTRPLLGGDVAIDHARIPLTALYNPSSSTAPAAAPPDVGFDLHVVADDDVRVVSPNVDVGALGYVNLGNTLAAPQLDGEFTATDGTLSFYRTFTLQDARVNFNRSDGVIPTVDAVATTTIDDPATDIVLHVTGPATGLNIAFASDPSYDRAQILGLLVNAQALGAVSGVAASGPSTPFSASSAVAGLAQGQINTLFTRNLLEPLSDALGKTLGFTSFSLTDNLGSSTGVGINARRRFGRDLNFIFAQTFGEPRRESFKLEDQPRGKSTAYALTLYSSSATSQLAGLSQPVLVNSMDYGNAATLPNMLGTNGFDVRYERKFP